jgi:outer membrane protein insertion porin family
MNRRISAALRAGLLSLVLGAEPSWAQDSAPEQLPIVERVDILNNQFVQKETLLFYISTKPGDRYDERRLKDDFRRLWETGFLEDLVLEAVDGPKGKIVRFRVNERARIQIVDFRGSKELTTTNIEDELKKRDAQLRIDTFYDPAKARKVEAIIKEMLGEKGRPFATVKHDSKRVGGAGTQVSFIIDDGPKARVKEIVFDGNHVYNDGKLRGRMKKLRPAGFWNLSWLGGKTTYTEGKWLGGQEDPRGDQGRLEDFYLNNGYVTARVGQPKISYTDGKSGLFKKKPVKWMKLDIPVTEGDQYRVGDIKFEGLTVLKEEFVRPLFKLQSGDVYNDSRFKKGFDKLRDIYGTLGYFQWTGGTKRKPDPERKVVDVTLSMDEDKRYYVGRIRFTGNDQTRDKVIRREVYMNEGDVFNTEALKLSIRRINQLGYFKPMEGAPDLKPAPGTEDKLDVTFKVDEQNRNQFTFGGGVSGLEGTFVNASFSTANFLGAGETFSLSAQTGARTKNYQLAITEPYLFDRPITAGFDIFARKLTYLGYVNVVGYTQESKGISLVMGFPVGRRGFSRLFTNYAFEVIRLTGITSDFNTGQVTGTVAGPVFDPFFYGDSGYRRESRFNPNFVFNTVDNPYTPHRGMKQTVSFTVAGGPLGGTVDYLRPNFESIFYIPHTKKTALGLRFDSAIILPYSNTKVLPLYQRYFLGGETQIRGYDIRTVGPVDSSGRAIGGNKYVLFNAEYYIDILGPLRFLFFFDAGQSFLEGDFIKVKNLRMSTGAEVRFIMPVLNVPFRLIYAINPNRDPLQTYIKHSTFKFAVGTTF